MNSQIHSDDGLPDNSNCGEFNPLHATFYADEAVQHSAEVTENVELARDTMRVRFRCPEIARRILPGQFLMLRLTGYDDPLIGRPLALFDTAASASGEAEFVDVVYLVKGKLTTRLARFQPGQRVDVWGPLGNGFEPQPTRHLVMVAGGIGQTPFLALAKEYLGSHQYGDPPRVVAPAERVTLCYGARSADLLAGVEQFQAAGIDVQIATDDGTAGHHGLVTDLLNRVLDQDRDAGLRVVCCGPEPMMEAVADVAQRGNVPCRVSLETPMACGIGICFTCVARIRTDDGDWDYKRTCVDGPVFDAEKVIF